jgi:hypothetical protein
VAPPFAHIHHVFRMFDAAQFVSTSLAQSETAGHTYVFNVGVS